MRKFTVLYLTAILLFGVNSSFAQENGYSHADRYSEVSPQLATADCKSMEEGWVVLFHIEARQGLKKRKIASFVEKSGVVHTGMWREKSDKVLVEWSTVGTSWRFKLEKHASYEKESFYPCQV